jgi:hypothetical protein
MWTIQEVAMARSSPFFQLGTSTFTWEELVHYNMPEYTENPLPRGERFNGFNLRTILQGVRQAVKENEPEAARYIVLLDIFMQTKGQGASEPRDKVFALYWITSITGIQLPEPDYAKPLDMVYMEVTKAIIEHDKTLTFLSLVNSEAPDPGFPSWVPDFRNLSSRWKKLYDMANSTTQMYYNPDTKKWSRGLGNGDNDDPEIATPKYSLSLLTRKLTLHGRILGSTSGTIKGGTSGR